MTISVTGGAIGSRLIANLVIVGLHFFLSLGMGVMMSPLAAAQTELRTLPEVGRTFYLNAFALARSEIRIEICVLEDPGILQGLKQAVARGVRVRAIVDRGKYAELASERTNLSVYLTGPGAELHLSNPMFPRSFPKVILIDQRKALIGSACLDTTTFEQYRDYVYSTAEPDIIQTLSRLFENDWRYTAASGKPTPSFNPSPNIDDPRLILAPANASDRLTRLIQSAVASLDVTSELLGNLALESELAAAAARGVRVRIISPISVNGATPKIQKLQEVSLIKLKQAGIQVHITGPVESRERPYMHARMMLADEMRLYIGSISFSPDSATLNREVGVLITELRLIQQVKARFDDDFRSLSHEY